MEIYIAVFIAVWLSCSSIFAYIRLKKDAEEKERKNDRN